MQIIILVAWLIPGRVFADKYITILKIQMEICKDRGRGRWKNIGPFNQLSPFEV